MYPSKGEKPKKYAMFVFTLILLLTSTHTYNETYLTKSISHLNQYSDIFGESFSKVIITITFKSIIIHNRPFKKLSFFFT